MPTQKYDLFISYADADSDWVEGYLLDALKQAEINYCSEEETFTLGAVRLDEFERAIRDSERTLLVLSHAYLADRENRFVKSLAQHFGLDTSTWPVIPLYLESELKVPTQLGLLVGLDATAPEKWKKAIERLCKDLDVAPPREVTIPECPYPGMIPFGEDDSDHFFGREREVEEAIERLRLYPFIAAIGPSGSGKSSLVFAGIIPALRRSRWFGPGEWLIHTIRPGKTPLTNLETILGQASADTALAVTQALATQPDVQRLLLVVDQFEEVFTQAEQEAVPFQQALLDLIETPYCYLILTVRADFYPDLMESLLWQKIQSYRLEIVPLDAAGLYEAIIKPAEDVGVYVEAALVERLVVEAVGEPGVLPLIQETLVLLWRKVERRFLPFRSYETLVLTAVAPRNIDGSNRPGLQVAIANRADVAVVALSEKQRQIARRIFLRLIQFGEGRADTRRQQSVEQLRVLGEDVRLFDRTLLYLADHRLLTLSGGEEDSSRKVDIAHEALIEGWPALQWWLTERREAEQTRRLLMRQVEEWVRLGKGSGGLLDEVQLAEAKRWLSSPDAEELGYDETLIELLEASDRAIQQVERQKQEQKQREIKQARIIAVVSISAALVLIFSGIQWRQTKIDQIRALRESSENAWNSNSEKEALRTSLKAGEKLKNPLLQRLMPEELRNKVTLTLQKVVYGVEKPFFKHEDKDKNVLSISVSPVDKSKSSRFLAIAGDNIPVYLWKLDELTKEPFKEQKRFQETDGDLGIVSSISFSPNNSSLLATGGTEGICLLNVDDLSTTYNRCKNKEKNEELKICRQGTKTVDSVAFSHDGKLLAAATNRPFEVCLWNLEKDDLLDKQVISLPGEVGEVVLSVSFSPDGKFLAVGLGRGSGLENKGEGAVYLLPLKSNKKQKTPVKKFPFTGWINTVSFSPDGKFLVAAGNDGSVHGWNLKEIKLREEELTELTGKNQLNKKEFKIHRGRAIRRLKFSSDGKQLATTGNDNYVRLWDWQDLLDLSKPPTPLKEFSHTRYVLSVTFTNQDGKQLATTGSDGTARLWPLDESLDDSIKRGYQLQ